MTTRRLRVTSEGTAFDVEVNAEAVRVQDATDDGASSGAEPTRDGARSSAPPPGEFKVTPRGADGLRVATSDHARAAAEPSPRNPSAAQTPTDDAGDAAAATSALVVSHGDVTWVWIDGEAWTIEVETAERARRPRAPAGAEGLSAPMPATVIRILAEPGKDVRRGETLLLLEAMKMELPVRAPRDGRVKAVHCQPGELVQPGVTLVDLE